MQQIRSQSSLAVAPTLGARLRGWVSRVEMGFSSTVSLIASRSVTMALLVIALVLSSGGYLVAAADHSLPGDQLYNIKIAVEDARLAMARSPKEKVKLQVAFADRRLEELNLLSRTVGADQRMAGLVTRFESSVTSASWTVSELSAHSSNDGLEVAKIVDDKIAEYQHSLQQTGASVSSQDVSRRVDKALVTVNKAGTQALKVIVDENSSPKDEVARKLDDKIQNVEDTLKIADAKLAGGAKGPTGDKARDQSSAAKENLTVAKQKIVEGDYKAAINILENVEDIVNQVTDSANSVAPPDGQVKGETDVGTQPSAATGGTPITPEVPATTEVPAK